MAWSAESRAAANGTERCYHFAQDRDWTERGFESAMDKTGPVFASAGAISGDLQKAMSQAVSAVLESFVARPTFACVFLGAQHVFGPRRAVDAALAQAKEALACEVVLGCAASGVIAERELEDPKALALFVGAIPSGEATPFSIRGEELEAWEDQQLVPKGLEALTNEAEAPILVFVDPYRIDVESALQLLATVAPKATVLGGLASASAGKRPQLIQNARLCETGLVGVQLRGDFRFEALVSQGCRPVGRPAVITAGQDHRIHGVRGRSLTAWLSEELDSLNKPELESFRSAPLVGRVIDEHRIEFGRGDFLIRPILGVVDNSLVLSDNVRRGQTIQLHTRNPEAAREDLLLTLRQRSKGPVSAALIFSCNGRGARFFGASNCDCSALQSEIGEIPVGGFFCGGEIGPVGNKAFLHAFTSCVGIFGPKTVAPTTARN